MINTSWKNKTISQQPKWNNEKRLHKVLNTLSNYPNLVVIDEIEALKHQLQMVSQGKAFIVQGGDCAETFIDFSSQMIKNKLTTILQMSAIIKYITNYPVINIGRIAGQFAKPRSSDFEFRGEKKLPIYRGDAINDINFSLEARQADPNRLLKAYHQSAATMNLIRSLIMEGFTDVHNIQSWCLSFLNNTFYVKKYNKIAQNIENILRFTETNDMQSFTYPSFYTSHESLLLNYEETFLQHDDDSNKLYNCSGHMVWIGDRTRNLDEAHIDFVSKISNPIGIKIGPSINIQDIPELCYKANPDNESGKLILIIRLGSKLIDEILPQIINIIKKENINVIFMCDPMHGNTITSKHGLKTRNFDTIKEELQKFISITRKMNCFPGGVHFELTGDNVTECTGGLQNITDLDLESSYQTACDPRLNNEQSLEMAFLMSEYMNEEKENS